MGITLPDSIGKTLLIIGIIIIAYAYPKQVEIKNKHYNFINTTKKEYDKISSDLIKDTLDLKIITLKIKEFSKTHNIENVIQYSTDSIATVNPILYKEDYNTTSLISNICEKLNNLKSKIKVSKFQHSVLEKNIELRTKQHKSSHADFGFIMGIIGAIFIGLGVLRWGYEHHVLNKQKIKEYDKFYSFCQSCAKNFSPIRKYGTNEDLSLSNSFCIECYQKGEFTKDITFEEFFESTKKYLNNKNSFDKRNLKIRFDNLKRWKKDEYL